METSRGKHRRPLQPLRNGTETMRVLTKRSHRPSAIPETMAFPQTTETSAGDLRAQIRESLKALPATILSHRDPRRVYNGARPSSVRPMRLRTPSPERLRRRMRELDKLDAAKRRGMPAVLNEISEVQGVRTKQKERERFKLDARFTELPTPVYNPPPACMPLDAEPVQRVLDRFASEVAVVLDQRTRRMPYPYTWLLWREFEAPRSFDVPARAALADFDPSLWKPINSSASTVNLSHLQVSTIGSEWSLEGTASKEPSMLTLEEAEAIRDATNNASNVLMVTAAVSPNMITESLVEDDPVAASVADPWRFFRATGGVGASWSEEKAHNRRMHVTNPFRRLVPAAWHDSGDPISGTLDLSQFHVQDEDLLELAALAKGAQEHVSPLRFTGLSLQGCEHVSSRAIATLLAARVDSRIPLGLLKLDLSDGVRGVTELFSLGGRFRDPSLQVQHKQTNNSKDSTSSKFHSAMWPQLSDQHGTKSSSISGAADEVATAHIAIGMASALRSVQELWLRGCPGLSYETVAFAGLRCPNLRILDLGYNKEGAVNDEVLRRVAGCAPKLESLTIHRASHITDEGLRSVLYACRYLSSLHASRCPLITGQCFLVAVEESSKKSTATKSQGPSKIALQCGRLQVLDLSHCVSLHPMTLAWASASAAPALRDVDVSGTAAIASVQAIVALCVSTKRLERLCLTRGPPSSTPFGGFDSQGLSGLRYPDEPGKYPGLELNRDPISPKALGSALGNLTPFQGLLELETDCLTDNGLTALLHTQGCILRKLSLCCCPDLKGDAFHALLKAQRAVDAGVAAEVAQATSGARAEAEAALEAAATAKDRIESAAGEPMRDARGFMVTGSVARELRVAEARRLAEVAREAEAKVLEAVEAMNHAREEAQRPKQRLRDRYGVEPSGLQGGAFLGQLTFLSFGKAHSFKPSAFNALAELNLLRLRDLSLNGLRGGMAHHRKQQGHGVPLAAFLKTVGSSLRSLSITDCAICDDTADAIAMHCSNIQSDVQSHSISATTMKDSSMGTTTKLRDLTLYYLYTKESRDAEEQLDKIPTTSSDQTTARRLSRRRSSFKSDSSPRTPPPVNSVAADPLPSTRAAGTTSVDRDEQHEQPQNLNNGALQQQPFTAAFPEQSPRRPRSAVSFAADPLSNLLKDDLLASGRRSDSGDDERAEYSKSRHCHRSQRESLKGLSDKGLATLVRALGQSLERLSLQGFPALTGGTSTSFPQSLPDSPPPSVRLGSATPQRGRLRPPRRRSSSKSARFLASNYLVFDLPGARGVPGNAFETSLKTKLEHSDHDHRSRRHSSRSRSSGSRSSGSSEDDDCARSSWRKVRRSIRSDRSNGNLRSEKRRSRSSDSNGSVADEGKDKGEDLLQQHEDSTPRVVKEEAPMMALTTDFEATKPSRNSVMEAWSPMPTQQRKKKEASTLFPPATIAVTTTAVRSSNQSNASETVAIHEEVSPNTASSMMRTTAASNGDEGTPSLFATMAVAASSIHALSSDRKVYEPSTETSANKAAAAAATDAAETTPQSINLLRGLAPHHPPSTWVQINRRKISASALEAPHERRSRRNSRRRSRRPSTHLPNTSSNSRDSGDQSSSSSSRWQNNNKSGQTVEEPLSPLSPGTPVLFNDAKSASAEGDAIQTGRKMTQLRSRQLVEESQSPENNRDQRSVHDKNASQKSELTSREDANFLTMNAEPPPEWSLPALAVVEVMECSNFSVTGLERLLANAPQLRRLNARDSFQLVPKMQIDLDAIATTDLHSTPPSALGPCPVNWKAIAAARPYCRPAPKGTGFMPAPDAKALWWRDSLWERMALEQRAGLVVRRAYRAFALRKIVWERWAGGVITRFWKVFNLGLLKLMRLHKKVTFWRKFKRQFYLNTLGMVHAALILQRCLRGKLARIRAKLKALVFTGAALVIQRMLRRHWCLADYFQERVLLELSNIEATPKFGFVGRLKKIHHKPNNIEASQLRIVNGVPVQQERRTEPVYSLDGTEVYDPANDPRGASQTCDLDVKRNFHAEEVDLFPPLDGKPAARRPLGLPPFFKSYYT